MASGEIEMDIGREPPWRVRHAKCFALRIKSQARKPIAKPRLPSQSIEPWVRLG